MLSPYGKQEWLTIAAVGVMLSIAAGVAGFWWASFVLIPLTLALMAFFRDPNRKTPSQRGAVVAPADGRISSIHQLEHFEPLNGPATCIRIFLSVLDVHINRSPCHGHIASITHKPGDHKNALNPTSAETNESNLIVLVHLIRRHPLAAVCQVAGLLARTIACGVNEGDVQRGRAYRHDQARLDDGVVPARRPPAEGCGQPGPEGVRRRDRAGDGDRQGPARARIRPRPPHHRQPSESTAERPVLGRVIPGQRRHPYDLNPNPLPLSGSRIYRSRQILLGLTGN
ncbi:MAG: phosphatidylserine decarboxylase [Phycisphaerales bacterium]